MAKFETDIVVDEKPVHLVFRPMTPEDAIEWSARFKSRMTYRETIQRELEKMEHTPVAQRDEDTYMALKDKEFKMMSQAIAQYRRILDWIETPTKAEISDMFNKNADTVMDACTKFLASLTLTEEDAKKSSAGQS
jgi:hypothetical protein